MSKKQRERKREDEGGESEAMAENEAEVSLFPTALCEIYRRYWPIKIDQVETEFYFILLLLVF